MSQQEPVSLPSNFFPTHPVKGSFTPSPHPCPTPLRYYNPGPGDLLDPRSSYYSFTMGPVFFLILDSESETHATSPQVRGPRI